MVTKRNAANSVNWEQIEKATEISRTYELSNMDGSPGVVFKMYKRSQFKRGGDPEHPISQKYMGKLFHRVGIKDLSKKSHKDKSPKEIFRERAMAEMMRNAEYVY